MADYATSLGCTLNPLTWVGAPTEACSQESGENEIQAVADAAQQYYGDTVGSITQTVADQQKASFDQDVQNIYQKDTTCAGIGCTNGYDSPLGCFCFDIVVDYAIYAGIGVGVLLLVYLLVLFGPSLAAASNAASE
jgi:hypothetical protein